MSTAFYPMGMSSYNNRQHTGGYVSPKTNVVPYQFQTGITASHIRPLTNRDPGNVFSAPFGRPRPIKHYRKGTSQRPPLPLPLPLPPNENENTIPLRISYRQVASSLPTSIGLGSSTGILDQPGTVSIQDPLQPECSTCTGGTMLISSLKPVLNLTEKPQPIFFYDSNHNRGICCSQERNARLRVLPASTNLSKRYYTRHQEYMYARCQTYEQREFNFVRQSPMGPYFVGQCTNPCVTSGSGCGSGSGSDHDLSSPCGFVVYKPSNEQYAVQGAVDASLKTLKQTMVTVDTSAAKSKSKSNLNPNQQKKSFPFAGSSNLQKRLLRTHCINEYK